MLNTHRKKFQDVPITPCFCCEKLCLLKQFRIVTKKIAQKNCTFLEIENYKS
jgi:hypothetical protein